MPKLYSCKFSGTKYGAVLVTAVLIGHRSGSLAPRTEFAPERENPMQRRGGFWVQRGFHYSGRYT